MAYEPLNEAKNEIRVLHFEDAWHPNSLSERLSLSIRIVSLNDKTEDYLYYQRNRRNNTQQIWQDPFTQEVELRGPAPQQNLASVAEDCKSRPIFRFAWGEYEALSYAWGTEVSETQIWLNGVLKQVSKNLEAALRALHRLPETRQHMNYWIDAICINQEDIEERNHQVKRMKEIYSTARAVIVWLGMETKDDDKAIRAMKATRRDPSQNDRLFPPSIFDAQDWKALCAFLRKPYWNRLWIIQELAVNPNSTLFLCGNRNLTRDMIKLAADCCQKLIRDNAIFTRKAELDAWLISTRVYRLVALEFDLHPDEMLKKALNLARQATATDERDKVYGILGLLDESISTQITPDYSDSNTVQHVFTELTTAIIRATANLEQIAYGAQCHGLVWPSWVPDLRLPFLRHHLRYLRHSHASGKLPAQFRFRKQPTPPSVRLRAKGIEVDSIDGIAASPALDDLPVYPSNNPVRYSNNATQNLARTFVMGHTKTRKHPALMKFPWDIEGKGASSSYPESVRTCLLNDPFCQEFRKFRERNQHLCINGKILRDYFPALPMKRTISKALLYHVRVAVISLRGRKLATSSTGHICLVPESVQKGDIVVILLGCNFPILLRRSGDAYRVLGESYVYGLMDGEVFEARKKEELPYKDFIII